MGTSHMHRSHTNRWTVLSSALLIAAASGSALAQNEWMDKIRLNDLHKVATGWNVLVGQIEPGTARAEHVALAGKIQFSRSTNGTNTNDKHATHVASIIAGRKTAAGGDFKGAAPQANLATSNWDDPDGAGPLGFEDDFLSAMTDFFRVAPTTPVLQISGGTPGGGAFANERARVQRVADWMGATGYLFVCSAGNLGAGTMRTPGSGYNVLTVGATGETGSLKNYDRLADYSGRMTVNEAGLGGTSRTKPDLVAPGSLIYSAREDGRAGPGGTTIYDQYGDNDFPAPGGEVSGTSFSTPMVTGVAACLNEWGTRKGLSKDPRLMRAVLMNSANKSVRTGAGDNTRWDRTAGLGKDATGLSPSLGTGQLDAFQAWKQYDAGQTSVGNGAFGNVPELGWDLSNVGGAGVFNGTTYLTDKAVRKGSYMTSTVCYNRNVTSGYNPGTGDNTWADWTYGTYNNLDIGIAEASSFTTLLQQSNQDGGTSEHSVFKTLKSIRYATTVFAPTGVTGNATFAHAWEWTAAPTFTKEYNGTFSGVRNFYQDDGWYNPDDSSVPGVNITKPAFVPDNEAAWALCLSSSNLVAQQVAAPYGSFTISFDYAFDGNNGTGFILQLGGQNIFAFDADPNSSIIQPGAGNVNTYKRYTATINDPAFFAAFAPSSQIELKFLTAGGPDRLYIDNLTYVPAPGAAALAIAGLGLISRRRRSA